MCHRSGHTAADGFIRLLESLIDWQHLMNPRQIIALVAPILLFGSMYPVFQLLKKRIGREKAWFAGFWVYWSVWCILFPLLLLGPARLFGLFQVRVPDTIGWVLVVLPPAVSLLGRYVADFKYGHRGRMLLVMVVYALMNGLLEEVLWRGVYIALFPGDYMWGLLWPGFWFAVWHFAPGSVSRVSARALVAGALVLGLCLGWVALGTGTITWAVLTHSLAGLMTVW
jgi:membrane protease YdiL (CAAX protease family)